MSVAIANATIEEKIRDLNEKVQQGQALEAFDEYYADDVVMMEGDDRWEGKETNREREEEFFSKITEFRGAEVHNVAVGDDVTMVEWTFDYTHEEWGDVKYRQVAVQEWNEDGQITVEKFFKL